MKSREYKAFSDALEKVLSVSHAEIKRREAEDKALRQYTMKMRGPKKKGPASGRAKGGKD